jgi:hypothetical protein
MTNEGRQPIVGRLVPLSGSRTVYGLNHGLSGDLLKRIEQLEREVERLQADK